METRMDAIEQRFSHMESRNVVDDLTAVRFHGSDKPVFTYNEIAERNNTSSATITRIAVKNGLSRRNSKSS